MKSNVSNRILVIRRRYLGDLVLLGPVLANLRQYYPHARITVLVDEKYGDVQEHNPDLNEILCIPQRQGRNYIAYLWHWLQFLFRLRGRFDSVYDLTRNRRSLFLARWTGARHLVSFVTEGNSPSKYQRYDVLAKWTEQDHLTLHIVNFGLRLLEADGVPIVTREVRLHVSASDASEAEENLRAALEDERDLSSKSTFMLVHPGARVPARCWQPENFAAVCDAVQEQSSVKVLLLAGPGEEDRIKAIQDAMHTRVRILKSPASVPKLAALLQAADLFLCNNSGPMHVAAAVGTPVVALFGAQRTAAWHPLGANNAVMLPSMPCINCLFPDMCQPPNSDKMWCIGRIPPAEVIEAVLARLRSSQIGIQD